MNRVGSMCYTVSFAQELIPEHDINIPCDNIYVLLVRASDRDYFSFCIKGFGSIRRPKRAFLRMFFED